MKGNEINWRAALLEAFFLVLGVLLAMGAANWRENRANERRAATALQSVIEELNTNHKAVIDAIDYHSQLLDTLYQHMGRYAGNPEVIPGTDVFTGGFVKPAVPLSGAWEAAMATGITEYMPFEDVLLISQIYKNQEQYDTQSKFVGQQIYGRLFDQGTTGILNNYQNLTQIIGSFVYSECGLEAEYASVIFTLSGDSTIVATPQFCNYIPQR